MNHVVPPSHNSKYIPQCKEHSDEDKDNAEGLSDSEFGGCNFVEPLSHFFCTDGEKDGKDKDGDGCSYSIDEWQYKC